MEKNNKFTREMLEMYRNAILEKPIEAKDLLEEIQPLLEEYFIGEFKMSGEELRVELLNGQKFIISIREGGN